MTSVLKIDTTPITTQTEDTTKDIKADDTTEVTKTEYKPLFDIKKHEVNFNIFNTTNIIYKINNIDELIYMFERIKRLFDKDIRFIIKINGIIFSTNQISIDPTSSNYNKNSKKVNDIYETMLMLLKTNIPEPKPDDIIYTLNITNSEGSIYRTLTTNLIYIKELLVKINNYNSLSSKLYFTISLCDDTSLIKPMTQPLTAMKCLDVAGRIMLADST